MKLAMISCQAYSDAWQPFIKLMDHFWPDHPDVTLLTDYIDAKVGEVCHDCRGYRLIFAGASRPWCGILEGFLKDCKEPILLMQEDFFINAEVRPDLIERGLEQMGKIGAGCVRLYPCPGGDEEYGDRHFAIVPRGTRYRVSCQTALWNPVYLRKIASQFRTPAEFEIEGTKLSDSLPEPVLAFKRNVQPWPLSYLCSAISRGEWNPAAKDLCESLNIYVDWTRRRFQAA
jgi:hypothetical protein